MASAPVEVVIGGHEYRVVASADRDALQRLARVVDAKLRELTPPGRALSPQAMVLAAIALAHDLEEERERRRQVERQARSRLRGVLSRIDRALEQAGGGAMLVHDGGAATERLGAPTAGVEREP